MSDAQQAKAAKAAQNRKIFVRNILAVYYRASLADIHNGHTWYETAQQIAAELSNKYGVTTEVAAGVIAALSPQNEWSRNVALAETLLASAQLGVSAIKTGGYLTLGLRKVDAILGYNNPDAFTVDDIADILNGDKIRAFFANICGDLYPVCVDGHAANIAQHGLTRVGITQAKGLTPAQYKALADAYAEAASVVDIAPAVMQAITWVAYRNIPRS